MSARILKLAFLYECKLLQYLQKLCKISNFFHSKRLYFLFLLNHLIIVLRFLITYFILSCILGEGETNLRIVCKKSCLTRIAI